MILQATMNCRALRVVDLSHNRIRSVQGLLPTVQSNGVTQLVLTGNPCAKNEEEMAQLEAMLAAKRYIVRTRAIVADAAATDLSARNHLRYGVCVSV